MTLASLFHDMMIISLLLIGGFIIRSFCSPLQKLFLPASIVGGILGLILGPQVLGWIVIPESFPQFNGVMMRVIMTCVVFGVTVNASRLLEHMDYALANVFLYGSQMILGVLIAMSCVSIAPDMPKGWGILGTFAYFGSHGSAAAAASVLEQGGSAGAVDIGMVLATGGLIWSMVVGMAIVNYGVRKGWATFVKDPEKQPDHFYRGILPEEERESIGSTTTTMVAVNPIVFQLGLLMVCYAVGYGIFYLLIQYFPVLAKVNAMLYGMIGGLIVWPIMRKTGTDRYVDKKTLNQISGFCLEILILTAMASISLDIVAKYWLPLTLHIVISCALTTIFCVWYFKKIANPEWFEKCLMVIGTCPGSSPNGLALVRAVDPNSESCVPQAHGVYNAIFWWNNLLTPVLPLVILASVWQLLGIAALFPLAAVVIAFLLFRKKAV